MKRDAQLCIGRLMPNTCSVSGNIRDLNFANEAGANLTFSFTSPTLRPVGTAAVVPAPVEVETDDDGLFTVDLVPGRYHLSVETAKGATTFSRSVVVPNQDEATLSSLLTAVEPVVLSAAQTAALDAGEARDAAAGFAGASANSAENANSAASAAAGSAGDAGNSALVAGGYAQAALESAENAADSEGAAAALQAASATSEINAANSASAAAFSASASATARTQSELAALAAGAKPYATEAEGRATVADGGIHLQAVGPGMKIWRRDDAGTSTALGWLGELLYDDMPTLIAATDTGFSVGQTIRTRKEGFGHTVVTSGEHLTTAGGVKLRVTGTSVSMYQFGAITTDIADVATVTAAWLAMVEYGRTTGAEIVVPPTPPEKYWPINYPAQAYSGMRLRMDGHLRNIWTSNGATRGSQYGDHFCIFFGTCDANSFQNMDAYAINDITAGQSSVTLDTAGDATNFAVGDIVVIQSAEGDTITGSFKPLFVIMNEVASIAGGTLSLLYPFNEDIAGAGPTIVNASSDATATIALDSIPCRAIKDVAVYGPGGFSAGWERWTGFGGCLRPNIKTRTFGSVGAFSVNAMSHGHVDVSGTVYNSGLEIAWGSHDLLVQSTEGLHFAENPNGSGISDGSVFYSNEHARRITFDNIKATAKADFYLPSTVAALSISHDCTIGGNVEIFCDASLFILNVSAASQGHGGHRIGAAKFYGSAQSAFRTRADGGGTMSDVLARGAKFVGTFTDYGLNLEGSGIVVSEVFHSSGDILVRSGSTGVAILACDSDAVPAITDSGINTALFGSYRRAETKTLGVKWRGNLRQVTLADDAAVSFLIPFNLGSVNISSGANLNTRGTWYFNAAAPSIAADTAITGTDFVATTGVLSGTTGTDGKINVSAAAGRVYIENRIGSARTLTINIGD